MIDLSIYPKGCDCITHDGPHWLHTDRLQFERNLENLRGVVMQADQPPVPDRSAAYRRVKELNAAIYVFAYCERFRIREKLWSMRPYIRDENEPFALPSGYSERDYTLRVRELTAHIKQEIAQWQQLTSAG